ncbi:uncharacterized protein K02A2.6 [Trichonephila clavata]|uniref:Uncharacterized protein K02A2.6 n=1 Tax=Trichonephila clavata TaxID=2740835 RepID=A0A8X6HTQ8_TRICU|nr:uncharacterized protein K02A2.6 [Trichonephila clavata]
MIYKRTIETPELILKEFADVFTGTGRLKRIVKTKSKEDSVPHVAAPRKVSLAIHNKGKEELNNMVDPSIWYTQNILYGISKALKSQLSGIVTVQTDHKTILGLSKKPYDTISPRLQRMLLRLNKYNIQLEYVPGTNLVIADALSRAQSTTDSFDEVLGQEATVRINLLTQASPTKWEEIAKMTTGDPEMQDVLFHISIGWPEKKKTKIVARPYWHCKKELYSTKEGIICRY